MSSQQVASLAEPAHRDNLLLPHAKAYVSAVMPEGLILDIDRNALAAELLSFPDLERCRKDALPLLTLLSSNCNSFCFVALTI